MAQLIIDDKVYYLPDGTDLDALKRRIRFACMSPFPFYADVVVDNVAQWMCLGRISGTVVNVIPG
jgi:hypothetical protein